MNERLLIARKRKQLTQDQLAEASGVSQADISRIESRGWIPPADIQERLAAAVQVSADSLFGSGGDLAAERHA